MNTTRVLISPAWCTIVTLCAGLVCWMVTTIIVEAELTKGPREWLENHHFRHQKVIGMKQSTKVPWMREPILMETRRSRIWFKIGYLAHCHLCAGVWVGILLALFIPGPFNGVVTPVAVAVVLNGLTYKAIGHLTLIVGNYLDRSST